MKKVLSVLALVLLAITLSSCGMNFKEKLLTVGNFQTEDKVEGSTLTINFNSTSEAITIGVVEFPTLAQTRKYTFTTVTSDKATIEMKDEKTGDVGTAYVTLLSEKDDFVRIKWETKSISTILKGRLVK